MNEGIRRLYLACKRNSCFPGPLPEVPNADGDDNNVSIHAILQCLGLIPSPGPVMFSPGSHETLENQTRKLALVPEPDEDGCRQGQSEIRDNLLKDSRLSAELKGDILPPTCGTKEDEKDAQDDTPFAVQEKLTRSRLVPSTDFVSNPQSALPVDTKAISSDTLFPHLLMSPVNSIDHSGPTTPADPYLDSAQSFSGGPSCTPELGQTSFLKPTRKMPPGYSYFVERERFYRSFFGSSNGNVDNQNYQPDIKDFLPLWPGAPSPVSQPRLWFEVESEMIQESINI